MIILLSLIAVLILGIAIMVITNDNYRYEGLNIFSIVITLTSMIFTLGMTISIPVDRQHVRRDIAKFEAFRYTIETARKQKLGELERVSILKDIATWNEEIAGIKYDNSVQWDLWIPDEVDSLELIK